MVATITPTAHAFAPYDPMIALPAEWLPTSTVRFSPGPVAKFQVQYCSQNYWKRLCISAPELESIMSKWFRILCLAHLFHFHPLSLQHNSTCTAGTAPPHPKHAFPVASSSQRAPQCAWHLTSDTSSQWPKPKPKLHRCHGPVPGKAILCSVVGPVGVLDSATLLISAVTQSTHNNLYLNLGLSWVVMFVEVSCFTLKIVSKLLLRWQLHFSKSLRVSFKHSRSINVVSKCWTGDYFLKLWHKRIVIK